GGDRTALKIDGSAGGDIQRAGDVHDASVSRADLELGAGAGEDQIATGVQRAVSDFEKTTAVDLDRAGSRGEVASKDIHGAAAEGRGAPADRRPDLQDGEGPVRAVAHRKRAPAGDDQRAGWDVETGRGTARVDVRTGGCREPAIERQEGVAGRAEGPSARQVQ